MDEIQCFASLVEGKKNRKNVQRNVNLLRSNYEVNAHLWRLQWVEFSGLSSPPPLSCLDEAM